VDAEQRDELENWAQSQTLPAGKVFRARLGRVHTTRKASTMNAKHRNAEKTTSSFSNREKMRRNNRSISLRFLYSARS
jgi:hypothetical protein